MEHTEMIDAHELTFSQAQGYAEIPSLLALEELSSEARLELWNWLYISVRSQSGDFLNNTWTAIFKYLHGQFLKQPIDTFNDIVDVIIYPYKIGLLEDWRFNDIFDLFQMIMRHPFCPADFTEVVKSIFERCQLAYFVDTNGPATILPMSTKQEGKVISEAIHAFHSTGLMGPETHLRSAAELINDGDWLGSIRESIHAVESVARQLAPDTSKTLGPALKSLEINHQLHPALKEAFNKLYGYTSDEEGIRHPLINHSNSPSGRDEAVFMLGACASFASYLWRVHQSKS